MSKTNNKYSNLLPIALLIAGVIMGLASGILALLSNTSAAPIVFGAGAAIAAIILTFTIALQQNADTSNLHQILIKIEEQTADKDYNPTSDQEISSDKLVPSDELALLEELVVAEYADAEDKPAYADEAIAALRQHKANLDFDDLRWRRKIPSPPLRGHHGWFVESDSDDNNERWFVRKANGLTVRKAMPRDFLETLEKEGGLDPRVIKHDFQLSNHALASWYARTYSDMLWKVSKSNRNSARGISVTLVNADI